MRRTNITICAAVFIMSAVFTVKAQKVAVDHYTTKQYDCAIFPDTYPTEFGGKPFTPTHDDIDKAEKALENKLKEIKCPNKDDKNEIVKNLVKYKMQFFGYTDKAGNKTLFINCFRNDNNKDKDLATTWLTEMIQVQDGGTYFWTIKYDLGKNELFEFSINGNG